MRMRIGWLAGVALMVVPMSPALAQTPAPAAQTPAPASPGAAAARMCPAQTGQQAAAAVRYVNPEGLFEAEAYSQAAIIPQSGGKLVYISGQLPLNDSYVVQGEDLQTQVRATLKNLCLTMAAAGVKTEDIVKLGVSYVHKDRPDPFLISEELTAFFHRDNMPATTMTAVPYLIMDGIRIQVEATAFIRGEGS